MRTSWAAFATLLAVACSEQARRCKLGELLGAVPSDAYHAGDYAISAGGRWLASRTPDPSRRRGNPSAPPAITLRDLTAGQLVETGIIGPAAAAENDHPLIGLCWTRSPELLVAELAAGHATLDPQSQPSIWSPVVEKESPCRAADDESIRGRARVVQSGRFEVDGRGGRVSVRDRMSGRTIAVHSGSLLFPGEKVHLGWAAVSPDGNRVAYSINREWMFSGPMEVRIAGSPDRAGSALVCTHAFGARWLPGGDLLALAMHKLNSGTGDDTIRFVRIRKVDLDR